MQRSAAPSQIRKRLSAQLQTPVPDKSNGESLDIETGESSCSKPVTITKLKANIKQFKSPFKSPIKTEVAAKPDSIQTNSLSRMPISQANKRVLELNESTTRKQLKLSGSAPKMGLASSMPMLHSSTLLKVPPPSGESEERCFTVLWRKKTIKKHKTWDGDGVLVFTGKAGVLKDMEGKDIGKGIMAATEIKDGDEFSFGGKDIELPRHLHVIPVAKFKSHSSLQRSEALTLPLQPRHNPNDSNAILLPRPPSTHPRVISGYGNKRKPGDLGLVDVVVDPLLGQHLRPHQKEGVRFLYECVMQMRDFKGQGAILADEMGLGKTLQTIALLWTLLKQSPYYGEESSVVKRALVVCPASLIKNWQMEFKKWLGVERLRVFAVDSKSSLTDFTLGKVYPVMVIGYEKLRMVQEELKNANFDIIICDEGHRLKTANIKTAQAIRSLSTKRRIILSGTPIQNDLCEFFSMIDFVNPGLFESYSTFKRVFEDPIVKSRQPDCSSSEADLGRERSEELTRLTSQFILRRTAQVNYEFLPKKSEIVVFCRPSQIQTKVYRHMVDSPFLQSCFSMDSSRHLVCISALRKLCNSPKLILDQAETIRPMIACLKDDSESQGLYSGVKEVFQESNLDFEDPGISGKLRFVDEMLLSIRNDTSERVVLVSNFTQTLDLLEGICTRRSYGYFRLDGSTPTLKRQEFVDKFNVASCKKYVFLLSAKSGGVGLNLIGASRLILFDIDWNPSVDLQAMARIHRDGQTRPVYIYRLLLSGSIEEKMYQRQLTKVGLSDALMDGKTSEMHNKFSLAELKDLFTLHENERCLTHSLLGCECRATAEFEQENQLKSQSILSESRKKVLSTTRSIMDEASVMLAKKKLEEWMHVDVQGWKESSSNGESESESMEDIDWGLGELAQKDPILWRTIMSSGENANANLLDSNEQCPVSFVFFKSHA
ncbi:helicase [Entomortierella beljakovae]|nr:helicase [Entomortierella beljakovae]